MGELLHGWTDHEPLGLGGGSGFKCRIFAYEDTDALVVTEQPAPGDGSWSYVRFHAVLLFGDAEVTVAYTDVLGVPCGPGSPAGGARTAWGAWVKYREGAYAELREDLPSRLSALLETACAVARVVCAKPLT